MVDLSQPGCGEIEESPADDKRTSRILKGIVETLLTIDLLAKNNNNNNKKKPKKYEEYARG